MTDDVDEIRTFLEDHGVAGDHVTIDPESAPDGGVLRYRLTLSREAPREAVVGFFRALGANPVTSDGTAAWIYSEHVGNLFEDE
jgi:hypothetical protein